MDSAQTVFLQSLSGTDVTETQTHNLLTGSQDTPTNMPPGYKLLNAKPKQKISCSSYYLAESVS